MAKFNNVRHNHNEGSYSEIPQNNKLRWTILFKEKDGSFTPTSKEFKCKDFLNDAVAKYEGHAFKIYQFDWRGTDINDEGLYLKLSNIVDAKSFVQNIGSIKNVKGYGEELILEQHDASTFICFIPRSYFRSTYTVSLLAYLIRVSNVDCVIEDWIKHPTKSADNPFGSKHDKIVGGGLTPPLPYAVYCGKSKTTVKDVMEKTSYGEGNYKIHDNGCAAWMHAIEYGME